MNQLANALIVVDVQVDFCPGGSLAVEHGDIVAENIREFVLEHGDEYIAVLASKCWHPNPEDSPEFDHFSDKPNFVNTWPVHCVADTKGAAFSPPLERPMFDKVFYKGTKTAAYSAFEGTETPYEGFSLDAYLNRLAIGHLDVCGIATDHCVFSTAMDGRKLGYDVTVFTDLCAGVNPQTTANAVEQMETAGIHLEESNLGSPV